ncbi:MAG TPA: hypothetical protein VHP33_34070 [Polyangiaceae bacterium]|nr:hypothetical protein [Polyangiaceae bacterium]
MPQYRLAWIYPEQAAPEQGILGGLRFEQSAEGLTAADSATKNRLDGGRALPPFAGSGFVFWDGAGLYRASSFLGRLEPLIMAPFGIDDVSFGPNFWLLRSREGERWAIDPKTGADVLLEPQGVLDIETAGDGRVVAALELGRALVSTDGGGTYREVQRELGRAPIELSREPLGFVLDQRQLVTLERDGSLVRRPATGNLAEDGKFRDRRLVSPYTVPTAERERFAPLNQALARGVSGPPGHALVALEASVCEVDLSTGKVVRQGPELLPGSPDCQLLRPNGELLMACRSGDALAILSKVDSEQPVLERSFKGHPALHVTADRLLIDLGCDAEPAPFSACTRFASGEWKQLSRRQDPAEKAALDAAAAAGAAIPPDPPVTAFVPRSDGGAVALVSVLGGYVDLASGRAIRLKGGQEGRVMKDDARCWVDGAGALRCLTSAGAYAWDEDGNPEPQVFQFSWVRAAGARGLGKDKDGRFFQTEDYGKTWVEVPGPPGKADGNNQQMSCSDVGCIFNGWLRTGWEVKAVKPSPPPLQVQVPARPPAPLPSVTCNVAKPVAPAFFQSPNSVEADAADDPKRRVAGFGVELLRADYDQLTLETALSSLDGNSMHGLLSTFSRRVHDPRAPEAEVYEQEPLRFRYLDYFDTSARINTAIVRVAELSQAARRLGTASPGTDFEGGGPLPIVPVLAREPGRTAGFILTMERARLWVNAGRVTLLAPWSDIWSTVSASLERDGSLLVLATTDAEGPRVWRHRQELGTEVFGLPHTPLRTTHDPADALGTSEQGEIAVLRFPSSPRPPTADDPPLAYVPGKPLEPLAPWSTLQPATAPACADKAGYRALVMPQSSWFQAIHGATEVAGDRGMVAAVRWSKERVCLEALEVQGSYLWMGDQEVETRLLWNPAQKNAASHVGIGPGYELREQASCQLTVAP